MRYKLAIRLIRLLARAQAYVLLAAFGEPVWVSTDGTPWKYHELRDRHLINILRKLKREGDQVAVYERLCVEADRRGIQGWDRHRRRPREGYWSP